MAVCGLVENIVIVSDTDDLVLDIKDTAINEYKYSDYDKKYVIVDGEKYDVTESQYTSEVLVLSKINNRYPDGHGNMRAWLYMVARNLFYNQHKKKSREILMDEQIYPLEEKTEKGLPEKIFEEEDRRMLYQAIRRLDIKKREIIQMQYFGGMTQKEIAAVLHITLENVRVLAYRARKELKKYLEECRKEESQ